MVLYNFLSIIKCIKLKKVLFIIFKLVLLTFSKFSLLDKNLMIQKKQPLTKQFLLSFKSGHGDFYQKFVDIIKGKVHFCRKVKQHQSCPPYMMAEKCIFMSILQRKHQRFANQQFDITQITTILQKYRPQISKSINTQKNIVFKKMKDFKIQNMQNAIVELITRQNFAFNSFNLPQNTYIYELFKAIFSRSQVVSMFGQPKYEPMSYSYIQIKQIAALFNENIMYFDYNTSKSVATNIQFNPQTIYILKVKQKYAILYVKQPKYIEIIEQGTLSINQVQAIFNKQLQKISNQQGLMSKLWNTVKSDKQNLRQTKKMFPQQVQCSKCLKKFTQFDCLKWNYQYTCSKCLQSPYFDTSNIPSTLIQKYFSQRGIKHRDFQITCAQCTGITIIPRYNPANKPQKYKCTICEYTICLIHNTNINQCYCECHKCRNAPTINIVNLNLAICQYCKNKFCRNCQKLSEDFCSCICKNCSQLKQDGHVCRQRCHFCRNHINNMKTCTCKRKICYGCYYFQLKSIGKDKEFTCPRPRQ